MNPHSSIPHGLPGKWALVAICILLAGCTTTPHRTVLTPPQAVIAAAEVAPLGVPGVFEFVVKASGHEDGYTFLNSEFDYRDQRNLSLEIPPAVNDAIQAVIGSDPATYYIGKRIRVEGTAKRVRIWFNSNGRRTEKYYYQTHLFIRDASKITVLP